MTAASVSSSALTLSRQADQLCRILGMPLWADLRVLTCSASLLVEARILVSATLEDGVRLAERLGLAFHAGGDNDNYAFADYVGVVADLPLVVTVMERRPEDGDVPPQ